MTEVKVVTVLNVMTLVKGGTVVAEVTKETVLTVVAAVPVVIEVL